MCLYSFCGLITLQVGTAVFSVVCFIIAMLSFGVNVFDPATSELKGEWFYAVIIVAVFSILIFATGVFMFFSAYNESPLFCYLTVGFLALTAVFWAVCTSLAFLNEPEYVSKVCVRQRCGESFWLAGLDFHPRVSSADEDNDDINGTVSNATVTNTTHAVDTTPLVPSNQPKDVPDSRTTPTTKGPAKKRFIDSSDYLYVEDKDTKAHARRRKDKSEPPEESNLEHGEEEDDSEYLDVRGSKQSQADQDGRRPVLGMVGAILFTAVNAIFFIFSITMLWSYAREINETDESDDSDEY